MRKNILFAMNWPENSSTMSRRAEYSYQQVAEVMSAKGVKCFISYPGELVSQSLGYLEKVNLNPSFYKTGELGAEFCDFLDINDVAIVVFIDPSRYYRGMFYKRLGGVRFVYYSRYGFYDEWTSGASKQFLKFLYHRLGLWSQYWGISDDIVNNLIRRELVPESKLFKIRNGVGSECFDPGVEVAKPNDMPDSPFIVLYIAQSRREKRLDFFIKVAKEFFDRFNNRCIRFVHVGGGPGIDELIKLSEEMGVKNNLIFVGEKSDVIPYLKYSSLYVHVSEKEGICNAISEAMLMELPVVAADIGGNREQVVNDETGFLVCKNDPVAFAEKINDYYRDKFLLSKHGRAGRVRILKYFSVENQVSGIVSALAGMNI